MVVGLIFIFFMENNVFRIPQRKTMQNHYEITSKSQFGTPNVRNLVKSLISGVWFLSPEAGENLRAVLGNPGRPLIVTGL